MKPCIEEEYIFVVVHLGIGLLARRKMTPWDLFENCKNRTQLFRARSPILLGGIK